MLDSYHACKSIGRCQSLEVLTPSLCFGNEIFSEDLLRRTVTPLPKRIVLIKCNDNNFT